MEQGQFQQQKKKKKKKKRGGSRTIILTNRNTFVPIKLLTRPQILPNRLKKKISNAVDTTKCYNNFITFLNPN